MRRSTLVLVVVAVVAGGLAAGVSAQERPNFSGRWTTDAAPSAAPDPAPGARAGGAPAAGAARGGGAPGRGRSGDMGSGWGPTITVVQDAARLTVEYMFFGRGDMQPPLKFVYALDGSETKNSVMMGRGIQAQTAKIAWDGPKLVITTVHTFPSPADGKPTTSDVTQTLSLESAASLVVDTRRSGILGAPPTTARTVYRKIE